MPKNRTTPRPCETCGRIFPARTYLIETGQGRYCSNFCRGQGRRAPLADRFWRYVDTSNLDGCWLWTGHLDPHGYGRLSPGGKQRPKTAHRMAWEITSGSPAPSGLEVCHVCDRPNCVRNDEPGIYVIRGIARPRYGHLWLGTKLDNMADMTEKGRSCVGEKQGQSKFTTAQIIEIRRSYADDGLNHARLARLHGCSTETIRHIVLGQSWRHLP